MKPRFLLQHLRVLALALVALLSSFAARADLAYADKPLFYAVGVKPNVALLMDDSRSLTYTDTASFRPYRNTCTGVMATGTAAMSRLEVAKVAACQVVQDNANNMRIALYTFSGSGANQDRPFDSSISNLQSTINGISASESTPLSSAFTKVVNDFAADASSPMQYRCQKNFIVFFTDGLPNLSPDISTSHTLPAVVGTQTSTWPGSTAVDGTSVAAPSWDGFQDPSISKVIAAGPGYYYPWLDDIAQIAYDVDLKTTASITPAAVCGGTAPAVGKDCAGKSWNGTDDTNASEFSQQNITTYTIGLGAEADNELLRDTPLVNRISIVPSAVNVDDDTLTIPAHGLKEDDYVHYYRAYQSNWSTTGTGDAGGDVITGANTANMPANVRVYYNNSGGTPLQYSGMVDSNACGEIGGLTMGSTYYLANTGGNTFKLADTKADAITCGASSANCHDLTGLGEVGTVHSFSRAGQSSYAPTLANTNTSGTSPINPTANTLTYGSAHSFVTGDVVRYTCSNNWSSNCVIPGLARNTDYYVAVVSSTQVRLASNANNAVTCQTSGGTSGCLDFTGYPVSGNRAQSLTRASTPALGPRTLQATGSGTTPVDTGTEQLTVSSHGFTTGDAVTYTCAQGINTVAGDVTITASTVLFAKTITANSFQLSLTAGGATIDITDGGNPAQNFAWVNNIGLAGIGGLYPYETDAPMTAGQTPSANSEPRGKYYVEVVDGDTIKLHSCSTAADCTSRDPVAANISSTGSGVLSMGPGKSYFATTAAELSAALTSAFTDIRAAELSFGTLGSNTSTEFSANTRLYQARFNTADWSGDVRTYKLAGNDIDPVPEWEASEKLPDHTARNIITRNGTNGAFDFTVANWSKLTATQQTSLSNGISTTVGQEVLNWTRGEDVANYRVRTNGNIGDILNSGLTYVGQPNKTYANEKLGLPASTPGKDTYNDFKGESRTPMVYGGSNGGMLHGFDASFLSSQGVEKIAFIPEAVYMDWADMGDNGVKDVAEPAINKFYNVARPYYGIVAAQEHHYFVNATPETGDVFFTAAKAGRLANSWHTVLVGGLGKGGRSVYALDVTDDSFGTGDVLWEFNDNNSGDMGYSYGQPAVALLDDGRWVAIFGNGYDSNGDQARIFVVDIEDGSLIQQFNLGTDPDNGVSSVTVLNNYTDADGVTALAVYAGDLQGNVWKVDLTSAAGFNATIDVDLTTPFFVAEDDSGNRQAITSAITLGRYPLEHNQGVMLFFGTGSYFTDADQGYDGTPEYDAMYGIWDNNVSNVAIADLVEQVMGTVALDPDGDNITEDYRTATQYDVDYSYQRGWYMKLAVTDPTEDFKGERVVFAPRTVTTGSYVLFTTVVPADVDPCTGGGSSNFYALDAVTGGAKPYAVFDLNDDGTYDDATDGGTEGVVGFGADGLASGVAVFDDGSAVKVIVNDDDLDVEGLNPNLTPPTPTDIKSGRMSWRQLQ